MGNYILATVLLLAVIIFTSVNSFIICGICNDIIGLIDEGKNQEAVILWENKKDYIAIFVRDAEIDVVNAEASQLSEAISFEDGEAEAGKIKFKEAVQEILNSEKPSFQDIF